MLETRYPRFGALYHNELEKLWAHRVRPLFIAFLVIVVGGSLLTYHSYMASKHQTQVTIQSFQGQVARLRRQESRATGKQQARIKRNLQQTEKILAQVRSEGPGVVNLSKQLHSVEQSLRQTPKAQRGPALEEIAVDRSALAHGIKHENPYAGGGLKLAGELFSGGAMILFGLIAAGLASDRISSELEGGTWGVLLLHAPRRIQVYWSKLAASLTLIWGFMAASGVGLGILTGLLMGFGFANFPLVVGLRLKAASQPGYPLRIPPQTFHLMSQWSYDALSLVLAMVAVGVLVTIFLALSLLTRSTVFSLIIGAVLVISGMLAGLVAHAAGWLAIIDPAVYMPLMGVWTGNLALQYNLVSLNLAQGLVVLACWAFVAIVASMSLARRMDL